MTKASLCGVAVLLLAGPLAAQSGVQNRVIGALDTRLIQPECKLEGANDFRIASGKTYLKTGIEGSGDQSNRTNGLKNGVRVITEAMASAGQAKNPAAWYYLGRIYLQQGDVVGADTAFTRAEALAPACKDDIGKYRHRAWIPLVSAAGTFLQAKQDDSALVMSRAANVIERIQPAGFYYMGAIFDGRDQLDSALVYFGLAAATQPTEAMMIKQRDNAIYRYARALLQAGRGAEAATAFRRYITVAPDDLDGQKGLLLAFRAAGMADSASLIEAQLVKASSSGLAAGAGLSENELFDIAAKQYNDKEYGPAAESFARIIALNPNNRDAIAAQANAYIALNDGAKLAAAAEQLLAIEPLSEYDHTLRIQGYKLAKNPDKTIASIIERESKSVNLEIENLQRTADGATLSGKLTGREPRDENNKLIPVKPMVLVVEFLGDGGTVVTTQELTLPTLKAGETQAFSVTAKGTGIKNWRYRVK
jgi:tetratricopeptide (TPR) repeat protein